MIKRVTNSFNSKLQLVFFVLFIAQSNAVARPSYYQTSATYNGSSAGTACASGYHMCSVTEWVGRAYDSAATGASTGIASTIPSWYNMASGTTSNCNNWASNSVAHSGYTIAFDNSLTNDVGWKFSGSADTCNLSRTVLCCSQ